MFCESRRRCDRLRGIVLVLLLLFLPGQSQASTDHAFRSSSAFGKENEVVSTTSITLAASWNDLWGRLDHTASNGSIVKWLKSRFAKDPWADHVISCEEMQNFPEKVFSGQDADLGSGSGSPNEVDYRCAGSLVSLKYMEKLYDLTELIRSEGPQLTCSGSIVHANWRYYHYDLLKAGFAPDIHARDSEEWERSANPYQKYQNALNYFRLWAHQSLCNFELYGVFWKEYNKVKPLLITHFKKNFGVSSHKATYYADNALGAFVRRAAGSCPYDFQAGKPSITSLQEAIASPSVAARDLENMFNQHTSQNDLDWALKTALLYQRPLNIIELLLQKGARIDSGDESALFFALRNREQVKFLLERGAEINYRNGLGKAALFYAVGFNDIGLVQLLLRYKADVNQAYRDKQTIDGIAWEELPFYQSYCLLTHTKRTPLMHAAQHGDQALIKLLLKHGARLDTWMKKDSTRPTTREKERNQRT